MIIDKLCYLSKLRYVNPGEKFAFAMLTLIFCLVSRSIAMGVFVLLLNAVLNIKIAGIAPKRYLNLMLVPLTFLLLSTLAIIVNFSKSPLDAFAIPLGSWYATGSMDAIMRAGQLTITALAAVSCLYFLSLNTTMTDILSVLRKLHVPALMVELMMLIYRYIFVLLDIAYYITTSQNARLGYKDMKTSLNSFGGMVQALFIRAMKRSRNLFDAMEARCYDGEIKVLDETHPVNKRNVVLIVLVEILLCAATVLLRIYG